MKADLFVCASRTFICAMGLLVSIMCRAGEVIDLYKVPLYGGTLSVTSTGVNSSTAVADKLFDGKNYSATGSDRILLTKPANGNPSVTVAVSGLDLAGSGLRLTRVDLYPTTCSGESSGVKTAVGRMPTEYRVFGIDADGGEHELAHPTDLSYPGLGSNASQGTFYSTEIPASEAAEATYGKFKLEFLNSPAWSTSSGAIVVGFMEINLRVEVVQDELRGEVDLARLLRSNGYAIDKDRTEEWTKAQNGWSKGACAFDGYNYLNSDLGADSNYRWMGYAANTDGAFVEIRVPQAYRRDDVFVLTRYRPWGLNGSSTDGSADRNRGPTEWKIFGTDQTGGYWGDASDDNWNEILHVTGQSWSGVTVGKGVNTLGFFDAKTPGGRHVGYRAFRFRPLDSVAHATASASTIDVGLDELELRVKVVNKPGSLRVFANVEGCNFGSSPKDGDLVTATKTVTAPKYVVRGTDEYRVKGYHVETFDYTTGEWNIGGFVDSRSYAYTCDANASERIFWELELGSDRDWAVVEEGGACHLTDGNFDLLVDGDSLANGKLTYVDKSWFVDGFGIFDLTKPIAKDGVPVTITEIDLPQLGSAGSSFYNFTKIVLPETLTKIVCTAFRDQKCLTEVVIDCPELTEMGGNLFTRDTALDKVVLKAPKLTSITGAYLFYEVPMDETDANEWQLDSLVTMEKVGDAKRFYEGENPYEPHGFYGTLTLPSVEIVGYADFNAQAHVTNVVLGSATASLKEIRGAAFQDATAIESLTIGCGKNLGVGSVAFTSCTNLTDVTFLKYVPTQENLDVILANSTSENRANVYVSPNRRQWAGFLQTIDETKDPNPPAGAVGVYEDANGVRKAWIFHKASPFDRIGTTILIR